jgi:hypothetical protein
MFILPIFVLNEDLLNDTSYIFTKISILIKFTIVISRNIELSLSLPSDLKSEIGKLTLEIF